MTTTYCGIDAAGFTRASGTAVCLLEDLGNHAVATVIEGTALNSSVRSEDEIDVVVRREAEYLESILQTAAGIVLDIPLDLQGLPCPASPKQVWELRLRPVDYAFDALAPLATYLGAPVARFAAATQSIASEIGVRVFESYPAAALMLWRSTKPDYKQSSARWAAQTGWQGDEGLATLLSELRCTAESEITLTDDDLDAILCAMAAVEPFGDADLAKDVATRIERQSPPLPKGYRIADLASWLKSGRTITVRKENIKPKTHVARKPAGNRPRRTSNEARTLLKCPIEGCGQEFAQGRLGWDAHVGSARKHPAWHPDVAEKAQRQRLFEEEFSWWFDD